MMMMSTSHEPVHMIRVGECFEWSELELEIFETFANSDHMNGCSAGLSNSQCKSAFCEAGSSRPELTLRQLNCSRRGAPENTHGIQRKNIRAIYFVFFLARAQTKRNLTEIVFFVRWMPWVFSGAPHREQSS